MKLSKIDIEDLLFYAFRYCIERKTYALDDIIYFLDKLWLEISDCPKLIFIKEILKKIFDHDISEVNRHTLTHFLFSKIKKDMNKHEDFLGEIKDKISRHKNILHYFL